MIGRRGNWLLKLFVPGGTTLEKMLEHIREFEAESKGFRFSGITVIAEPHLFTMSNIHRPKEQVYAWSESTYGPGLDNDMMMKLTLDKLEAFSTMLGGTPFTVAIPDFYQELAEDGKLTCGSVEDFEKFASKVSIECRQQTDRSDRGGAERTEGSPSRFAARLGDAGGTYVGHHRGSAPPQLDRLHPFAGPCDFRLETISGFRRASCSGPFSQIETLYQEK